VGDYALSTSLNEMRLSGDGASISIVTSGGFDQPITFSCSGLPAGYTCSFSPASITPDSTGIKTTKMTIVGQSSAALNQKNLAHGFITALAGLGFLGLPLCWRFRRKMVMPLLILALAGSLGCTIQGCGSSTPTATYSVVVTGTSLPLTHSVTIQVRR
jgi:hypothetical protein